MIRNYFITAIRNLLRSRIFTLINITGLAIGILSCVLAAVYVSHELSFDEFHNDADRIYRVALQNYTTQGPHATTPMPIGPAMKEEFPEVEAMTRVQTLDNYLTRRNENAFFEKMTLVDSTFLDVFSFRLLSGNPAKALNGPNQVILTERMAKKYFGNSDPVGEMLNIGSSGRLNSIITAVVADPPGNSQLQFDFLLTISTFERVGMPVTLWFQMPGNHTYVKLREQASAENLTGLFPDFVKKYIGAELPGPYESNYQLILQPLKDIHLGSKLQGELSTQGSSTAIYLFISIAAIILVIACINYVNLTSARYLKRAREMGIRKVAGASRVQLVWQLLGESILISLAAGVLAMVAVQILLPSFNNLAGTKIDMINLVDPAVIGAWLIVVMLPALGAGLIPAGLLTRVRPIQALAGAMKLGSSGLLAQRGLVVFQLVSALLLISASVVVFRQMDFIRGNVYTNDGREQLMVFSSNGKVVNGMDVLRQRLLSNSRISGVTASSSIPGFGYDSWGVQLTTEDPEVQTENFVVDEDYVDVMQYKFVAGRNFDRTLASDSAAFIINEKAVREFGFGTPEAAIGKNLFWGGQKQGQVIGVLKDFHFKSFREEIKPALLQLQRQRAANWHQYVAVRLQTDELATTLTEVREAVAAIDEGWVVDYHFADEKFESLHRRDVLQGRMFGIFSIVAVLISCMGLLGLAIFSTTQRNKEMGIRKALGATSSMLATLIMKDFVILFGVAFLISFPVSYYLITQWLMGFAYHTVLSADVYLLTGGMLLAAVLLTIAYQTLKTAGVNPAEVLKSE